MRYLFPVPNTSRVRAVSHAWEQGVGGPEQRRAARRADELGFDYIQVPEHLVVPARHVELSGAHYFHAASAQAFFLGATERIRLVSAVTILPLQHPIAHAKALATIDWLSSGRCSVAFGLGWLRGEYEALGVPFEKRGRLMDEYLEAIIALWTQDAPEYAGEFVSFRNIAFEPKPVQQPHVPIWIGGDSDPALKRAARFATGWAPYLTKPGDFRDRLDFMKSQPGYHGQEFEVMYTLAFGQMGSGHVAIEGAPGTAAMSTGEMVDLMGWLRDCGVTIAGYAIPPVPSFEAYLDHAQWFIEEVKPRVE